MGQVFSCFVELAFRFGSGSPKILKFADVGGARRNRGLKLVERGSQGGFDDEWNENPENRYRDKNGERLFIEESLFKQFGTVLNGFALCSAFGVLKLSAAGFS